MNSPRSSPALLAPGASGSAYAARAPGRGESLPAVDDRLVAPESRAEIVDGLVYRTMGSNQPHGTRHFEAAHVFAGTLADGYAGAVDMLTRADEASDAAPDVSVFPEAPDPETGGRQLEEIVMEVLDSERLGHATTKVELFAARGVRRLFALRVSTRAVLEWDHARHDWAELGADAVIVDRCFRVPIPARALVDRVLADDTVARALLARGNRVLVAALEAERAEGLAPLVHQFERRLRRALTAAERDVLRARLSTHGAARLGDAVLDLDGDALGQWLGDEHAR